MEEQRSDRETIAVMSNLCVEPREGKKEKGGQEREGGRGRGRG